MRQRVEKLVASNRQLKRSEYSTASRMSNQYDQGDGSSGKARSPHVKSDRESEGKKTSAIELFSLIDPYIEEQSTRITKLFEHESAIHNLDKSETERILREKITKSNEESNKLKDDIEKLKRKLNESKNMTNMLRVESDVLQAERRQLLSEVSELRSQMQAVEDNNTGSLLIKTKELIDTKTNNVVLQRDLAELKDLYEKRDAEGKMLEDELKQWGGYVRHDRKKKDEEIIELKEANNDLDEKYKRVKKELADLIDKYHEDKAKLNKDIEFHLKTISGMQESHLEVKNQLNSVSSEYNVYRQTYEKDKYIEMMRSLAELKHESVRTSDTLSQLERLNKSYKTTIEDEESKNKGLNNEIDRLKSNIDGLRKEIVTLKQEIYDAEIKSRSKKSVEIDPSELVDLKQKIVQLKAEVGSKKTEIEMQNIDIESLKKQLEQAKDAPIHSTPQQPQASADDGKMKEMLKRRDEKIKLLQQEIKTLKEATPTIQNVDNPQKQDPQPANTNDQARKVELEAAQSQIVHLNQNIETLKLQNTQLQSEVKDLKAKLEVSKPQDSKATPSTEEKKKDEKGVGLFW